MKIKSKLLSVAAAVLLLGGIGAAGAPAASASQYNQCGTNTYQGTLKACNDPGDFIGANIKYHVSLYFGGNPGYTSCTFTYGLNGSFDRSKSCLSQLKNGGTVTDYWYDFGVRGNYTSAKVTVCAGPQCATAQINSPKV